MAFGKQLAVSAASSEVDDSALLSDAWKMCLAGMDGVRNADTGELMGIDNRKNKRHSGTLDDPTGNSDDILMKLLL